MVGSISGVSLSRSVICSISNVLIPFLSGLVVLLICSGVKANGTLGVVMFSLSWVVTSMISGVRLPVLSRPVRCSISGVALSMF